MIKRRSKKRFISEINVVPYIDVMLVLLIIFMVTAPLLQQGVAVDLPHASASPLSNGAKEAIVVSVNDKGEYFLNACSKPDLPIEISKLQSHIKEVLDQDVARRIVVKGDKRVDYGKVVGLMVALQKAGVPNVGLLTQDE